MTYTDNNPSAVNDVRTVTFQVDDGFANNDLSNTQARNINVSTHFPPTLSNIESGTLPFTAGQGPTNVTNTLTVTDPDSITLVGATVTISAGLVNTEDVLGFTNQNGIAGSYNASSGRLTLSGVATVAQYQAALQSVTYNDTNLLPAAGTRTITFQADDGSANNNLSNTQSRNVAVSDHIAPVLANIEPGTISYVSGQGPVNITSSLTVTDSDSATISSASVSITSNFAGAEDVLNF